MSAIQRSRPVLCDSRGHLSLNSAFTMQKWKCRITAGWNVHVKTWTVDHLMQLSGTTSAISQVWFKNKSPAEFRAQRWNVLCQWVTMSSCNLAPVSVCVFFVCVCVSHSFHSRLQRWFTLAAKSSLVSSHDLQLLPRIIGSLCLWAWVDAHVNVSVHDRVCVPPECVVCVCLTKAWKVESHPVMLNWL